MSKDNKVNLLPEWPAFGGNRAYVEGMWFEMIAGVRETNDAVETHTIYVLDDGETYSTIPAAIVKVTQDELDEIENGAKVYRIVPDWNQRDEKGGRR